MVFPFNKILFFVLILFASLKSNCQKIKVSVDNQAFLLTDYDASTGYTLVSKEKGKFIIAYKIGYVPETISLDDLFEKLKDDPHSPNIPEYKFNLKPLSSIPVLSGSLKGIRFTKFVDPTNKIGDHPKPIGSSGGYGYAVIEPNVGLEDPKILKEINAKLKNYGYNVIEDEINLFTEKKKEAELYIAAEILQYYKETKGTPGYIISVILKWSVYDPSQEKIVFTHISGGYSNEQVKMSESEVFLVASRNALLNLMNNPEFIKVVKKEGVTGNANSNSLNKILLASIPAPILNESLNYIESSIKSVVTIKSSTGGHGSGFLVSSSGYILTNFHVIDNQGSFDVIFSSGITLPAEVVRYNKKRDVALLKIPGSGYLPLALDTVSAIGKIGSDVIAIGTPKEIKLGQTVTKGIISGMREFENQLFIQTDASINPGNSGGPLITKKGQVIGVVVSGYNDSQGLSFVIPINEALKTLNIELKN